MRVHKNAPGILEKASGGAKASETERASRARGRRARHTHSSDTRAATTLSRRSSRAGGHNHSGGEPGANQRVIANQGLRSLNSLHFFLSIRLNLGGSAQDTTSFISFCFARPLSPPGCLPNSPRSPTFALLVDCRALPATRPVEHAHRPVDLE
jgi:hypothetical protein